MVNLFFKIKAAPFAVIGTNVVICSGNVQGVRSITCQRFLVGENRVQHHIHIGGGKAVDMHLDGPNVERLSTIITNQSKTAQFVVVSLRKPMLDNADRMIGVTQKDKGVTKISGIKIKD